ncbi:hypothetical protein HYY74_00530 [Candidatus Woesearchaeota archaeon]|nr:hypothetical protein [Candidatus Woesearchaeota archaeon]
MAIYLAVFWAIAAGLAVLFLASYLLNKQKFRASLENNGGFFVMIAGVFLAMALISKDPVTFLGIEMSVELQWFASLMMFGFGAWQFYLNPLEKRLARLERNFANFVGVATTNFGHISKDFERVNKEFELINKEFERVNKGIDDIKADLRRKK